MSVIEQSSRFLFNLDGTDFTLFWLYEKCGVGRVFNLFFFLTDREEIDQLPSERDSR